MMQGMPGKPPGGMPPGRPMGAPMGGAPPRAAPPPSTRSMFNPQDVAGKAQTGDISMNMTLEQFFQKNYGLSMQSTLGEFIEKTKGQMKNATMLGKAGAQQSPQGPPAAPRAPMGAPSAPPRSAPPMGMDGLMSKLGG